MKALISPNEPLETGYRVAEVKPQEFEVAPSLFWVDCSDDCAADSWFYNPETKLCELLPPPEPPEPVTPVETLP